jgi:putative inorganic carbon (HCO3(-)) transporter
MSGRAAETAFTIGRRPRQGQLDPAWQRSVPAVLVGLWAFLLPIQFEAGGLLSRIAISDFALLAYLILRLPRLRHVRAAWSGWCLALVAVMGIGVVVAVMRTGQLQKYALLQKGIGLLVLLAAFVAVVDFCRDWERIRWLLRVFVLGVTLNAVVSIVAGLLAELAGVEIPAINEPYQGDRLTGLLVDPNAFGGLVGVALVLHAVTALGRTPLLTGPASWLASVTLPAAIVLTFSRSSWLGLAAGLAVLLLLRPRACVRLVSRLTGPLLLLTPLLAVLLMEVEPDAAELASRPQEVDSRVAIGLDAIPEITENPLFGMGLGAYLAKYNIIVHNTTLWFLTELGVVGLLAFVGFVVAFFAKLLAADRIASPDRRPLLLALLAAHGVMIGISIGIEALYQRYWWLVLGCAGAAYATIREMRDARPDVPTTSGSSPPAGFGPVPTELGRAR